MKLNIAQSILNVGAPLGTVKPELYLVRLQSRIPKFIKAFGRHAKIRKSQLGLKRGMTLRVMATSDKDAQQKALRRKRNSMRGSNCYLVRWSRKFYA